MFIYILFVYIYIHTYVEVLIPIPDSCCHILSIAIASRSQVEGAGAGGRIYTLCLKASTSPHVMFLQQDPDLVNVPFDPQMETVEVNHYAIGNIMQSHEI